MRVLERREIVGWRAKYIRKITAKRSANARILYQDETWVNQGYTTSFAWYDENVEKDPFSALVAGSDLSLGYKDPSGRGQHLIISHIGGSDGFIEEAADVFRSKKTCDYHEEMNASRWENWWLLVGKNCWLGKLVGKLVGKPLFISAAGHRQCNR